MKNYIFLMLFCLLGFSEAQSAIIFFDDFNTGASSAWGNERGSWYTNDGVYNAAEPDNDPMAFSEVTSLTDLTDFVLDVDVNDLRDGGILLRSSYDSNNLNGVLLVTGGYAGSYSGLYWHIITNNTGSAVTNPVDIPGLLGSDAHLTVKVEGDTYSAYVNGSSTPSSSITTNLFDHGSAGLYDFSAQSFDNFQISDNIPVPEPASVFLLFMGITGLVFFRKRVNI